MEAASARGAETRAIRVDPEREQIPGGFDYVLGLDILARVRNPLAVLEKLVSAARDCLILEIPRYRPDSIGWWGTLTMAAHSALRLPAITLLPLSRKRGNQQGFRLTSAALTSVLKVLRQDIARIEICGDEDGEPTLFVVRRRRIGQLHVLAGVNAVGKSHLLDRLRSGTENDVASQLGIDLSMPWSYSTYTHLLDQTQEFFPYLIVQYNITAPAVHGDLYRHTLGLQDLIETAENTTITTMWLPADLQRERYLTDRLPQRAVMDPEVAKKRREAKTRDVTGGRKDSFLKSFQLPGIRSLHSRKKVDKLLEIYANDDRFWSMYEEWFSFAKRHANKSFVLLQEPDYRVVPLESWLDEPSMRKSWSSTTITSG